MIVNLIKSLYLQFIDPSKKFGNLSLIFNSTFAAYPRTTMKTNLYICIENHDNIGLKDELDKWNWTKTQLTEAFVLAVTLRSMKCVDIMVEHPLIGILNHL